MRGVPKEIEVLCWARLHAEDEDEWHSYLYNAGKHEIESTYVEDGEDVRRWRLTLKRLGKVFSESEEYVQQHATVDESYAQEYIETYYGGDVWELLIGINYDYDCDNYDHDDWHRYDDEMEELGYTWEFLGY